MKCCHESVPPQTALKKNNVRASIRIEMVRSRTARDPQMELQKTSGYEVRANGGSFLCIFPFFFITVYIVRILLLLKTNSNSEDAKYFYTARILTICTLTILSYFRNRIELLRSQIFS